MSSHFSFVLFYFIFFVKIFFSFHFQMIHACLLLGIRKSVKGACGWAEKKEKKKKKNSSFKTSETLSRDLIIILV